MRVLVHIALIDGTGAEPVTDAAILIDGERIVAAGPRSAVTAGRSLLIGRRTYVR